jgi:hypothetical protein
MTFVQQLNRQTTHFSERNLIVKRLMTTRAHTIGQQTFRRSVLTVSPLHNFLHSASAVTHYALRHVLEIYLQQSSLGTPIRLSEGDSVISAAWRRDFISCLTSLCRGVPQEEVSHVLTSPVPLVRGFSGGLVVKGKLYPTSSVCVHSMKTFILCNFACYVRKKWLKITGISDLDSFFVLEV